MPLASSWPGRAASSGVPHRRSGCPAESAAPDPVFAEVDVTSLQLIQPRSAGVEAAGLAAMDWLGIYPILADLGFKGSNGALSPAARAGAWRRTCNMVPARRTQRSRRTSWLNNARRRRCQGAAVNNSAPIPGSCHSPKVPGCSHSSPAIRWTSRRAKCSLRVAFRKALIRKPGAGDASNLSELFSTSGQYDLLGKFYLDPGQDIGLFVTEKIQTLPGVRDTYTLIAFNAFGGGKS
jgi:hypothetical protein